MALRYLKMQVTRVIKTLLFYGGFFRLLQKIKPNPRVAILRYHAVVESKDNYYASPSICVTPRQFERHVRYFAKNYTIMSLDEVVERLTNKEYLPANAVVFTFDDGYADNYLAHEILKKYKGTGTFYLTAECIDRREAFWLFEVTYLPLFSDKKTVEIKVEGERYDFALGNRLQRWQAVRNLVRLIKSNNREVRESIRRQLREQLADKQYHKRADNVMLTWEQVRKMRDAGMTIGAHTLTHLNLPNAGEADAKREIAECKTFLEEKLDQPIVHFSYPNSGPYEYYTDAIRDVVEASGYVSSVTSYAGFADQESDFFCIKRVRTVPSLIETVAGIELGKLRD